jgi:hypothetical protein
MKEDYPRTLLELEERFSTVAACIECLRKLRCPNGLVCLQDNSNLDPLEEDFDHYM